MSFRVKSQPAPIAFQIAPVIDFLVVLLCYTITAQIYIQWEAEIDVQVPTAETGDLSQRLPGEIIVNILKDGSMVVNSQVLSHEGLRSLLARVVKIFPGQPIVIRADESTAYAHIIKALDLCRQTDIWNISFATRMPEQTPR